MSEVERMADLASLHFGTCAWTHEDWRGVFYPAHLPAADRLAFYSRWMNAVEVDSTFYHFPTRHAVEHWVEVTPPGFRFSCKMPREFTHERKLRECDELLRTFLDGIEPMGDKLGCILLQLPPWFTPRHDEHALREFLHGLPRGFPWAVEFRDHLWHFPRIAHLLEEHGVAWVWNDRTTLAAANEAAFEFHPRTADFAVLRLLGDSATKYRPDGSEVHHYRKIQWPRKVSLDHWASKIALEREHLRAVYVFGNNHFEGFAPLTVQSLAARLGESLHLPGPSDLREREHAEQQELW